MVCSRVWKDSERTSRRCGRPVEVPPSWQRRWRVFGATTGFFLLVDRYFAEWMPDGEIVVLALGFLILSRFFSQKDRYIARFGEQAYARAFTSFGIPGLGIVFGAIAHLAYMPGPLVPDVGGNLSWSGSAG